MRVKDLIKSGNTQWYSRTSFFKRRLCNMMSMNDITELGLGTVGTMPE